MKKIVLVIMASLFLLFEPYLTASQNVKGYTGLFNMSYPFTLAKGVGAVTFGVNNVDLKSGDVDANLFYLGGTYGIAENLELNVNFSYNRVKKNGSEINFDYPFANSWQTGMGYAEVGLKYNFLKSKTTGFGVQGYLALPLSDESKGVTTSKSNFGIDFLFAHKFADSTILSLSAGYMFRQDPDQIELPDSFNYGVGLETGITDELSLAAQFTGKVYSSTDYDPGQSDPVNVIIGLKYEKENCFGASLAYKKNLAFDNMDIEDTHGAIGSVWFYIGKPEPVIPPCTALESANLKGDDNAKEGEIRDYQAVTAPQTATAPVTYVWTCSENGALESGQGTPTVRVKWNQDKTDSWVKVVVSNRCSNVNAELKVKVIEPVLPPKEEYFFAIDSYELSSAVAADLNSAIEYYKYHPEENIEVQGHTCSIATVEYNLALGEHRANAIKDFMVKKGISAERIKTISYGEEKPAYDNSVEKARKKNRRVYVPRNIKK